MQVPKIQSTQQNTPNFNGRVIIYGELGSVALRSVRKAMPGMENLIKDKPYDMFIDENSQKRMFEVVIQKLDDFGRENTRRMEYNVPIDYTYNSGKNEEKLVLASKEAIKDYENLEIPSSETPENQRYDWHPKNAHSLLKKIANFISGK